MNITKESFVELINMNVKGNTMISIDVITEPKMRKTDNPYMGVRKHQTKSGIIGFDYTNAINNQAAREDLEHREAKKRAWGVLSDNRIWVHNIDKKTGMTKIYLQMKVQSTNNTSYIMPDGTLIDSSLIYPFLPEHKASSSQADLEKEVIVNDIFIDNIVSIRMFGKTWNISEKLEIEVEEVVANEAVMI